VLRRLSDHFNRFAEVQSKFKSALIYPAVVRDCGHRHHRLFHDVHAAAFLTIFEGLKVPLAIRDARARRHQPHVLSYWWVMALIAITDRDSVQALQSTDEGKRKIDGWKMNAPVIGKVFSAEHVWPVRAHALDAAHQWRAGADGAQNHGADYAQL
jgi:hypothetical protein